MFRKRVLHVFVLPFILMLTACLPRIGVNTPVPAPPNTTATPGVYLVPSSGMPGTTTYSSPGITGNPESFESMQVDQNLMQMRDSGNYTQMINNMNVTTYTPDQLFGLSFERVQVVQLSSWPSTPEEAATAFTGSTAYAFRFERNANGGWHLMEGDIIPVIVPVGIIFEGYNDYGTDQSTSYGGRGICWTAVSNNNSSWKVWTKGGTFWVPDNMDIPGTARKIISEQIPYPPGNTCVSVGFD